MARSSREQLTGLTGLRGIGALWVFFYHVQYDAALPGLNAGYLGVDLFFILSGFILSHSHADRSWGWPVYRAFIIRRALRMFPLHLTALFALLVAVALMPGIPQSVGPERFTPLSFFASVLLVQNWGFPIGDTWNGPAWSLSAEWLASLLFPVFLVCARQVTHPLKAMACVFAAIAAFQVFLLITHNPTPHLSGRAGLIRLGCEFLAGCLLYRAYLGGYVAGRWAMIGSAALIVLGVSIPPLAVLAVYGMPIILLLAALPGSRLGRLLSSALPRWLGEISFSIYLLHSVILYVTNPARAALGLSGLQDAFWTAGLLALTLGVASLSYYWIEAPPIAWGRRLLAPREAGAATPQAGQHPHAPTSPSLLRVPGSDTKPA